MTITKPSDAQLEAGDDNVDITLVYEAATALDGYTLEVDVGGIKFEDDDEDDDPEITALLGEDDKEYGFVDDSGITDASLSVGAYDAGDGVVTITSSGLTFNTTNRKKYTITIENVSIQDEGGNVTFTTRIAPDGDDVAVGGSR